MGFLSGDTLVAGGLLLEDGGWAGRAGRVEDFRIILLRSVCWRELLHLVYP